MKVLYIGGVYYLEYSLYRESLVNPNIEVRFLTDGFDLGDGKTRNATSLRDGDHLESVRREFQPDLTIVRCWCSTSKYVAASDLFWEQEIGVTTETGEKKFVIEMPNTAKIIACCSEADSRRKGWLWLPYCVSRNWSRVDVPKDISVLVATNIPDGGVAHMKMRSMDILVKPLVEYDSFLVYACNGTHGGLQNIPYLRGRLKPSFPPLEAPKYISRAKIYVSPTTLWYDEGYVSYKTVEAMGCGTLVLTNNYVGMTDMFGPDGENLIYANTPEESLEKVRYYLSHDKEREEIARRGCEFIHRTRAWEPHLQRVFNEMKAGQ